MRLFVLPLAALPLAARAATPAEVVDTCADIVEAAYGDSHAAARDLQAAVESFLAAPSEAGRLAARAAWVAARVTQQTEAFRLGNPTVDDWEGRVNAWPLDEGLIHHVSSDTFATDDNPAADPALDAEPRAKLDASVAALREIVAAREAGTARDVLLAPGNPGGERLIGGAVDRLVDQTRSIERALAALGLEGVAFEGSDSLDDTEAFGPGASPGVAFP